MLAPDVSGYGGVHCWKRGYTKSISVKQAREILMDIEKTEEPDGVAHKGAFSPQDNCIFIYDKQNHAEWKDVLSDRNGVWINSRGARKHNWQVEQGAEGAEELTFRRSTYKNATCPTFHRVVVLCEKTRYFLVQYYYDGDRVAFSVPPHGNRTKGNKSYARKFESIKLFIKQHGKLESLALLEKQN